MLLVPLIEFFGILRFEKNAADTGYPLHRGEYSSGDSRSRWLVRELPSYETDSLRSREHVLSMRQIV
jgi:hypothetical protein